MSPNLRKAAVLIRSLDSDAAAIMLAQLSREEAATIRAAIRELGPLDAEEQADVAAEFRSTRPAAGTNAAAGVELSLSSPMHGSDEMVIPPAVEPTSPSAERFAFLATASTSSLVRFLVREHAQTIAVVLSHLAPARAANVLAELPDKLQADTIERLSALGETDPESVTMLERELAVWLSTRGEDRDTIARRRETVSNILAAADESVRRSILSKLKTSNRTLADQIAPPDQLQRLRETTGRTSSSQTSSGRTSTTESRRATATGKPVYEILSTRVARVARTPLPFMPPQATAIVPEPRLPSPQPIPLPRIEFDQLIHLDTHTLTAVLREVDANVLALALAGSREDLVDRICDQMPKRTAREFRRGLRKLGPTRLSDVAAAQRAVANTAARHLAKRQQGLVAASR